MLGKSLLQRRMFLPLLIGLATAGSLVGYAYATGALSSLVVNPKGPPRDQLVLTSYTISFGAGQSKPTILAMWLKNVGDATANLSSLTLQDTSNGGTGTFSLNNQSVASSGGTAQVSVDTSNSGFYFTQGHGYSFTVTTLTGRFVFAASY